MTRWVGVSSASLSSSGPSLPTCSYYGQHLVRNPSEATPAVASPQGVPPLSPPEERLLELIGDYQRRFAAEKLVIGRDGRLTFDGDTAEKRRAPEVNLIADLFGEEATVESHGSRFEMLMDGVPEVYLRRIPEMRLSSPFVVTVTTEWRRAQPQPISSAPIFSVASFCIPGSTCAYTSRVIAAEACPSRSLTTFTFTPIARSWVAAVWRRSYGPCASSIFAASQMAL